MNYARRDLCGGCPVMGIPTAIKSLIQEPEIGGVIGVFLRFEPAERRHRLRLHQKPEVTIHPNGEIEVAGEIAVSEMMSKILILSETHSHFPREGRAGMRFLVSPLSRSSRFYCLGDMGGGQGVSRLSTGHRRLRSGILGWSSVVIHAAFC